MPSETPVTHHNEPAFWNEHLHKIPWCENIRQKSDLIRQELLAFINHFRPFMPYPKYGDLYRNTWDAFPLSSFQGEYLELSQHSLEVPMQPLVNLFRAQLPMTVQTITELESQGHLRNVFVSKLTPGSVIKPHRGWTSDYLRIHLCIKEDPECLITVGTETRTWHQGELLAFKDGGPYAHSVIHAGSSERIVVSFDLHLDYVSYFIPEVK
jgi:Aspartyl/Asparaginyl beta-hydroxylase